MEIQVTGLNRVIKSLNPRHAEKATVTALNKAGAHAFSKANQTIRDEYNIKLRDLKAIAKLLKAHKRNPSVLIRAKGKGSVSMMRFKTRRKRPIQVEIKRGKKETFKHAFEARVSFMQHGSGGAVSFAQSHGIFQRKSREVKRLPIEKLYAVSAVTLYGSRAVEDSLYKAAEDKYFDEFFRAYNYHINKGYR